jgi:hypothetical protein
VIDAKEGTIDGKKAEPPIGCSKEFEATGNPSCHISTYKGGWRCCEHGVFVVDTAMTCRLPNCAEKPQDEIYMKFTFYYEDAMESTVRLESAACCDVTSTEQGDQNIEYDIPACAAGTPPEKCIHVAESVQPIAYFGDHYIPQANKTKHNRHHGSDLVDMVFAAPHLHWAGISLELIDAVTNRTLCEVHRAPDNSGGVMYGTGSIAGDEKGYLTGLRPCTWSLGENNTRFRRDHPLRARAVYDASSYHMGVMSLWLMSVSEASETNPAIVV